MSTATANLKLKISYEDVPRATKELMLMEQEIDSIGKLAVVLVKELSTMQEVLKSELGTITESLEEIKEASESAADSLDSIDEKTGKLGLVIGAAIPLMGGLFNKMMDMGRASPLLASSMAMINWQMEEIGMVVGDAIAPAFEVVVDLLQSLIDWWYNLDEGLKESITIGMQVAFMLGVVAAAWVFLNSSMFPIIAIIVAIVAGVAILIEIWKIFGDDIIAIVEKAFGFITGIIDGFLQWIDKLFDDPLGAIIEAFTGWYTFLVDAAKIGWDLVKGAFDAFLTWLGDLFEDVPILGGFVDLLQSAWDNIKRIIDGIIGVFDSLIKFLTGETSLSEFVSEIINSIGDIVGGLINLIIDPINNALKTLEDAINMIRNIEIFGSYLFRVIPKVDIPRLPEFHEGGYIGGGFGSEIPILAKAEELILNTPQQNIIEQGLNIALASVGGASGGTDNTYYVTNNVYMDNNSISGSITGKRIGSSIFDELKRRGI